MGENSKIQWTTHTMNPWRGCTKISPGCAHCYADTLSKRNPGMLGVWGPSGTRVVASESMWKQPLKWDRWAHDRQAWMSANATTDAERPRVFCASLADIFEDWSGEISTANGGRLAIRGHGEFVSLEQSLDESASSRRAIARANAKAGISCVLPTEAERRATLDDVRARLFRLIDATPNLDWLLLTKRPENIATMTPENRRTFTANDDKRHTPPRPNVWLGVSVEDQKRKTRIDVLRDVPAAIRFLSLEPLLEDLGEVDFTGISWCIVGGESGPHARPMHPDWARSIRDQCRAAGVPFFFKQWGELAPLGKTSGLDPDHYYPGRDKKISVPSGVPMDEPTSMFRLGKKTTGRLLDGRTWDELPLAEGRRSELQVKA